MLFGYFRNKTTWCNRRKVLVIILCSILLLCGLFGNLMHINLRCCTTINDSYVNQIDEMKLITDRYSKCFHRRQSNISCSRLVMGDRDEISSVEGYLKQTREEDNCLLYNFVENCSALKIVHRYVTDDRMILPDERNYPLAFAIKMHKTPEQAEQLLRTIYRPHNVYCIYVDKKSDTKIYDVINKLGKCFPNVFVIEDRINMVYSSINLIEAELQCMKAMMRTQTKWKYYINLTGQEFPLKTNYEIVKILQKLNGANDIESYKFPFNKQQRYTIRYEIVGNGIRRTGDLKSSFIKRFQMSKGSAYGAFTRDFVNFILTDSVATKFLKWLNGTYAPEESAWATLNALPWAPGGYPKQISQETNSFLSREVNWAWEKTKCHGSYVRGVCVYGSGDLPFLVHRNELFANKFDIKKDHVVLDCMEDILYHRSKANNIENLNWHFYNTLPHVQYYSKFHSNPSDLYFERKKEIWLNEHNVTSDLKPIPK